MVPSESGLAKQCLQCPHLLKLHLLRQCLRLHLLGGKCSALNQLPYHVLRKVTAKRILIPLHMLHFTEAWQMQIDHFCSAGSSKYLPYAA